MRRSNRPKRSSAAITLQLFSLLQKSPYWTLSIAALAVLLAIACTQLVLAVVIFRAQR